jgi:hypothetical protein
MAIHLPKTQRLRQELERDCSVPVFAELTGVSSDEILRDFPHATIGRVTVEQWKAWLEKRGLTVVERDGCPSDIVPCVHLVATHEPRDNTDFHWIYRDEDGDVHDPSPVSGAVPADDPTMRDLTYYRGKILTLSVLKSSARNADRVTPSGERRAGSRVSERPATTK